MNRKRFTTLIIGNKLTKAQMTTINGVFMSIKYLYEKAFVLLTDRAKGELEPPKLPKLIS